MEHLPATQEQEDTEIVSPEIPSKDQFVANMLLDIGADRSRAHHVQQESVLMSETLLADIPEDRLETARANIKVLHHLNGHRGSILRDRVFSGTTPFATHLRTLYEWSKSPMSVDPICADAPEGLLELADTPAHLYEVLTFLESHREETQETYAKSLATATSQALGLPEGKDKWVDGISPTFNTKDRARVFTKLFHDVGFIPEELTTKKAFQKVPIASLIASVDALRTLEAGEYGEEARYERARLLNAMIAGGNLAQHRAQGGTISLDSNGIFINVDALHTHLPYGLIEPRTFEAFSKDDTWLSPEEVREAQLRCGEENNEVTRMDELMETQLATFTEAFGVHMEDAEGIANMIEEDTKEFAKKLIAGNHILPDNVINSLSARGASGIVILARLGEEIGEAAADEATGRTWGRWRASFSSHQMLQEPESEYEERSKILNSPKYYNASKSLRAILNAIPNVSDVSEFVALRGAYKRIRNGDQHSFVEVFHRGDIARILINEDKHLQGQDKVNFNELPLFEREQYEDLERALHSYSYFHEQVGLLRKPYKSDFWGYQEYFRAAESALYFVSTHCSPIHDQRTKDAYAQLWIDEKGYIERREIEGEEWPGARGQLLQSVLDEADQEYRTLLFKSIGSQTNFIENFMPQVTKTDEILGEEFATQTRERCASWGYDEDLLEELSKEPTVSRVVRIDYKKDDPTRSVPFHIEEAALDALRIPRNRPLISIIGGARYMEQEGTNSLSSMSEQVLAVAHKHKMNVAVPGTQSGIGTTFGRENMRYKKATSHLPHADKAHLFAISPGGNTDFPGNPYLDPAHKHQIYAMTPVDSIMTPFFVNWEAQGAEKRNSSYVPHVDYAEALKARLAGRERRLTVIANGGLYATMEITKARRLGGDMMFVQDSGRLAQVVSTIMGTYPLNGDMWSWTHAKDDIERYRVIMEALKMCPSDVAEEFMSKDFGRNEICANEDETVYREYFYHMLWTLQNQSGNHLLAVPLKNLEQAVDQYFTVKVDNDSRYPIKEIYLRKDKSDPNNFDEA